MGKPIFVSVEDADSVGAFSAFQLEGDAEPIVETRTTVEAPDISPSSQPVNVVPDFDAVSADRIFASPLARKVRCDSLMASIRMVNFGLL